MSRILALIRPGRPESGDADGARPLGTVEAYRRFFLPAGGAWPRCSFAAAAGARAWRPGAPARRRSRRRTAGGGPARGDPARPSRRPRHRHSSAAISSASSASVSPASLSSASVSSASSAPGPTPAGAPASQPGLAGDAAPPGGPICLLRPRPGALGRAPAGSTQRDRRASCLYCGSRSFRRPAPAWRCRSRSRCRTACRRRAPAPGPAAHRCPAGSTAITRIAVTGSSAISEVLIDRTSVWFRARFAAWL